MARPLAELVPADLRRPPREAPHTYPGWRCPGSVLLVAGPRVVDLPADDVCRGLDQLLGNAGVPGVRERTAVLAVGANAAPLHLAAKLAVAGVSPVVPMLRVLVTGLAVGASAHLSRPGYIPATPRLLPGSVSAGVLTLLDEPQLRAVDATEPNYCRLPLPTDVEVTAAGARWPGAGVYVSRRGELDVQVADLSDPRFGQARLWSALVSRAPGLAAVRADVRRLGARGAAMPTDLVDAFRDGVTAAGLVVTPHARPAAPP